jgi:hypothetical protein
MGQMKVADAGNQQRHIPVPAQQLSFSLHLRFPHPSTFFTLAALQWPSGRISSLHIGVKHNMRFLHMFLHQSFSASVLMVRHT